MSARHTYDQFELDQYYDRISLPKAKRVFGVRNLSDEDKLVFLRLLNKHHLVKVPWENLTQHYSWHKVVNIKPRHLFREIVGKEGRGGYCMQVNYFFHLVLFSLGYDVYMSGSRIYHDDTKKYGGWTHVLNLISIGVKRYMVDGGFGPQGPVAPVLLEPGLEVPQISPAQMRVVLEPIPNNLDQTQKIWIYQYRYKPEGPWTPGYCFVDLEFTPEDVESMNFEPWCNKRTFFTHEVAITRFSTEKETKEDGGPGSPGEAELEGEINGAVSINHDVLKWRRGGEKYVVEKFQKDGERVEGLRKYFGIHLSEEEQEGITGTAAMVDGRYALGP